MTDSASTLIAISTWAVSSGRGAGPEFASSLQSSTRLDRGARWALSRVPLPPGRSVLPIDFARTELDIVNRVGNIELQVRGGSLRDRQLEPFPIGGDLDGTLEVKPEPVGPLSLDAGFPLPVAAETRSSSSRSPSRAEVTIRLSMPSGTQAAPVQPGDSSSSSTLELGHVVLDPAADLDRRRPHGTASVSRVAAVPGPDGRRSRACRRTCPA